MDTNRPAMLFLLSGALALLAVVPIGLSACAGARPHAAAAPASPKAPDATAAGGAPASSGSAQPTGHPSAQPRHGGGVNLATGIYRREDDDLVIDTPMRIVLHRAYSSGDDHQRQFGRDWTHGGEWFLFGDGNPRIPWADVCVETGECIHFTRITPGWGLVGAVLRHDGTPTRYDGALLAWNASRWEMRFADGATATFLDCASKNQHCRLVESRDAEGHRIDYVRDPADVLLRMESEGQSIAFDYDDQDRIVRAYDTRHRQVRYEYNDAGRLTRATSWDGTVREYEYSDRGKLAVIREPGRTIRNTFDDAGRMIRQVVTHSEHDPNPYVATVHYVVRNGSVVEADFDEGDGLHVYRFNEQHYTVFESLRADGPAPIEFTYELDAGNRPTGATLSCTGPGGPVTQRIPPISSRDSDMKWLLARRFCQPGER
jgi:YD repeat-containing protein